MSVIFHILIIFRALIVIVVGLVGVFASEIFILIHKTDIIFLKPAFVIGGVGDDLTYIKASAVYFYALSNPWCIAVVISRELYGISAVNGYAVYVVKLYAQTRI